MEGARFLFGNVAVSCASLRGGNEGFGALLAHSMGLGKTLTTIALIDALLRSKALAAAAKAGGVRGFHRVLIVAPATVRGGRHARNVCARARTLACERHSSHSPRIRPVPTRLRASSP